MSKDDRPRIGERITVESTSAGNHYRGEDGRILGGMEGPYANGVEWTGHAEGIYRPAAAKRRYRYTEPAFGDFIVSGEGRMFGSEYAIPVEAILDALGGDFVVIPKSELPAIGPDGKLTGLKETWPGLPAEDTERAEFYRNEAAAKLALALHASLQADRKAKLTVKLAADLEQNLQHSDMTAFAKDLVNLGWTKPAAN